MIMIPQLQLIFIDKKTYFTLSFSGSCPRLSPKACQGLLYRSGWQVLRARTSTRSSSPTLRPRHPPDVRVQWQGRVLERNDMGLYRRCVRGQAQAHTMNSARELLFTSPKGTRAVRSSRPCLAGLEVKCTLVATTRRPF